MNIDHSSTSILAASIRTQTASAADAGQILSTTRTGAEGRIRNTAYVHLPDRQATLDGPLGEVGQIVRLLTARGELVHASVPVPSPRGVMVTIQFAAVPVRPGAIRGPGRRRPWSTRPRVAIAITLSVAGSAVALLAVAGYLASAAVTGPAAAGIVTSLVVVGLLGRLTRRVLKTAVASVHRR
jgi:hypothetical protein